MEPERELFDEFKRVDAICRDMFSSQYGVSAYISQMEQVFPRGRFTVPTWDKDYQMLKRVRWLRNQIAHDMTVVDCTISDVEYLRDFHNRLLIQEDPLAALRKVGQEVQRISHQKPVVTQKAALYTYDPNTQRPSAKRHGILWGVMAVAALIIFVVLNFFR